MAKTKRIKAAEVGMLEKLDLTENEAKLYIHMLECDPETVQELGTHSPFPRTMLYHILKQLVQRGLVTARKEGWRTVYTAADPEMLYDLLARKERNSEEASLRVRELIPRLKHSYRLAGVRPSVRLFEGVAEYEKALEHIIVAMPNEVVSYEMLAGEKPGLETRQHHEKRRINKKIMKKVLFYADEESLKNLSKRPYDEVTQFRSVHKGTMPSLKVDLVLFDNKLLYSSYDTHEPTAVLIEDRALYTMQKNMFDFLWKQGTDRTLMSQ